MLNVKMYYIAPLVLILGLSGALYKTQEVFSMDAYTVQEKVMPQLLSGFGRREYLAALEEKKKAAARSGSGGGGASAI